MDITITLTIPEAFQVEAALEARLAKLRDHRATSADLGELGIGFGHFGVDVLDVATRNTEAAREALTRELYAETVG